MEEFLYKFSTLPKKFIKDFFIISKEEYYETDIIINFDIICLWLDVRKDHLQRLLCDNFEENYDYIFEKKQKKQINSTGKTTYNEILITPNCFKELCMISQTSKAKEVRKYFIEMERLIKRYYETIKEKMYNDIGLLKINQKPKIQTNSGVLYIIKTLNTDETLYKIGKSQNLRNRLNGYNSGNANDIEPEFIIPVKDINSAEKCVKAIAKRFQYRKYKEVYEMDLNMLKSLLETCSEVSNKFQNIYEINKKDFNKKIKIMKGGSINYYLYIDKLI